MILFDVSKLFQRKPQVPYGCFFRNANGIMFLPDNVLNSAVVDVKWCDGKA